VATAILAGVIAEILVQPAGAPGNVPGVLRYGAPAAGFVAFVPTAARSSRGRLRRNRDAHREVVVGLMRRNCGAAAKG